MESNAKTKTIRINEEKLNKAGDKERKKKDRKTEEKKESTSGRLDE